MRHEGNGCTSEWRSNLSKMWENFRRWGCWGKSGGTGWRKKHGDAVKPLAAQISIISKVTATVITRTEHVNRRASHLKYLLKEKWPETRTTGRSVVFVRRNVAEKRRAFDALCFKLGKYSPSAAGAGLLGREAANILNIQTFFQH